MNRENLYKTILCLVHVRLQNLYNLNILPYIYIYIVKIFYLVFYYNSRYIKMFKVLYGNISFDLEIK